MDHTKLPNVGDYGTLIIGTDEYALEVIEVINARKVIVRYLDAVNTEAFPEQEYEFTPNEDNRTLEVTRTQKAWQVKGEKYMLVTFAFVSHYRDPHF